ncbi:MAG: hypothetical protein ACOVP4_15195 [Bacteriovoracaceae bacterium]|jgi:hypothetical protein
MKFMSLVLLVFSFSVFAEGDGEMFQKGKAMMLSNMDKRISILQESKSCISSASNRDQMKACRDQMKAKMKEIKEDAKEGKVEMKEKFKQMKLERKSKKSS